MKSIGRRLFAKAAVGAPAMLKRGEYRPVQEARLAPGFPGELGPRMSSEKIALRNRIWGAIQKANRTVDRAAVMRDMRRNMLGGIDADLAVMNSMSLVRRVDIQIERNRARDFERENLRASIIRMMGGDPEDFQ